MKQDTDLIRTINNELSDTEIEKTIRKAIPHPTDRDELFFMKGYTKGAAWVRDMIIEIIKNGKH